MVAYNAVSARGTRASVVVLVIAGLSGGCDEKLAERILAFIAEHGT